MMHTGRQALSGARALSRSNGTSYLFQLEEGLPDLPVFRSVLDLYESIRGDRLMPAWRDFSFRDLRGWHSDFALYEFDSGSKGTAGGICKMMGERYQAYFKGAIRHGMPLEMVEDDVRPTLLDYLGSLLRGPAAGFFTGHMSYSGREHVELDILDLPVTDRDGQVCYLMSFASRPV